MAFKLSWKRNAEKQTRTYLSLHRRLELEPFLSASSIKLRGLISIFWGFLGTLELEPG